MQNTSGMTHPVQCSTSLKETESPRGEKPSLSHSLGSGQLERRCSQHQVGSLVVAMMVKQRNRGVKCRGDGIPRQVCACALAVYNFVGFYSWVWVFFPLCPPPPPPIYPHSPSESSKSAYNLSVNMYDLFCERQAFFYGYF